MHLHGHDGYSMLDALGKPIDVVSKAKELGQIAIAQTNHMFMGGYLDFYDSAKEVGIKPILGLEAYIVDDMKVHSKYSHITLLAKNLNGLRNLFKIVSNANINGFYYVPRTDVKDLFKYGDDLIVLSGCINGYFAKEIDNDSRLDMMIRQFYDRFGKDFYIELMPHNYDKQKILNDKLLQYSKKYGIDCVATEDFHYINSGDTKYHNILIMIKNKKNIKSKDNFGFSVTDLYIKSRSEMERDFKNVMLWDDKFIGYILDTTLSIADQCNVDLENRDYVFPKIDVPSQFKDSFDYLKYLALNGLEERGLKHNSKYIDRLNYELKIISEKHFSDYFLIVRDFIKWAKDKKIPVGPGRGSAVGSLIAYLLKITEVDPIKYELLFERFINPLRIKIPDIDTDFGDVSRNKVKEYLSNKYGQGNVVSIGAYSFFTPNNCFRDVCRTQCLNFSEINDLAKTIYSSKDPLFKSYATIDDNLEVNEQLQKFAEKYPDIIEAVRKIQLQPRHFSVAAAGMLITNDINNYTAIKRTKTILASELDKINIEKLKLLKIDVLGLKTLTILDFTLKQIGKDFSFLYNLKIDNDKNILAHFCNGDTDGVFQFESKPMKELLKRVKPNSFEDIIVLNALYRPAVISSGMLEQYINRRNGYEKIQYFHPIIKKWTESTYGIIVFQEQLMGILTELGIDMATADLIRYEVEKGNQEQILEYLKDAHNKNLSDVEIKNIINYLLKIGGYAFNKSHSTAYAMIAWYCMYLKTYYPFQFIISLLNAWIKDTDTLRIYIRNLLRTGIKFGRLDINTSDKFFIYDKQKIRFGFYAVKGIGEKVIDEIIAHRPYVSFDDFLSKVPRRIVNKKIVEILIKAGAFDNIEKNAWDKYGKFYKIDQLEPYNKIKFRVDAFGFYFSPQKIFNKILKKLKSRGFVKLSQLYSISEGSFVKSFGTISSVVSYRMKNKNLIYFVDLEDRRGNNFTLIVYKELYNPEIIKEGNFVKFIGIKNKDKIILNKANGAISLIKE